jgi:Amt family ammonium transporter
LAFVIFSTLATPAFAETSTINAADTAWMIVATALVLMMTIPGLALFYCGMVRKKNVLATMAQSLSAVALGQTDASPWCSRRENLVLSHLKLISE